MQINSTGFGGMVSSMKNKVKLGSKSLSVITVNRIIKPISFIAL